MKRLGVEWTHWAREDLRSIVTRIALDAPLNALKILERLEAAAGRLEAFPQRGARVPELEENGVGGYRQLSEPPWRIVYRVEARCVLVVAVVDGRRQLEDLLLDRLLR